MPLKNLFRNFSVAVVAVASLLPVSPAVALDTPTTSHLDRRLYETIYKESQVYPIYAVNGLVTSIIFGEDERVVAHTSGFSTAWEFAARGNHFFLKPRAKEGSTNLIVVTTKRTYHFDLRLGWNRKTATYELSFSYPEEEAAKKAQEAQRTAVERRLQTTPVGVRTVSTSATQNRMYTMNFGSARSSRGFAPLEAFDDGRFTYLRFDKQADFPAAYRVLDNTETLVNSHVEGDWLVLHGVFETIRLRAGQGVVGLYNEAYSGSGVSVESGVSVPGLYRENIGGM